MPSAATSAGLAGAFGGAQQGLLSRQKEERGIEAEKRAEDRRIATEGRAETRGLSAEARAANRGLAGEGRSEARAIAKEGRAEEREITKERRLESRQFRLLKLGKDITLETQEAQDKLVRERPGKPPTQHVRTLEEPAFDKNGKQILDDAGEPVMTTSLVVVEGKNVRHFRSGDQGLYEVGAEVGESEAADPEESKRQEAKQDFIETLEVMAKKRDSRLAEVARKYTELFGEDVPDSIRMALDEVSGTSVEGGSARTELAREPEGLGISLPKFPGLPSASDVKSALGTTLRTGRRR